MTLTLTLTSATLTSLKVMVFRNFDASFSFRNMFNTEFLSDCKIKASNGKMVSIFSSLDPFGDWSLN